MKYLKLFEELHQAEMLKHGFEEGEYPEQGKIYFWVESGEKYGKQVKNTPVKVKFDVMYDKTKSDFGYFFIEENTNTGRKKGERVCSDIHGLFKDYHTANQYANGQL
jgi:uncharacterized protein YwqG